MKKDIKRASIVEAIKKMSEKTTGRGATPAEAESALLKAQHLMAKYNISEEEIGTTNSKEDLTIHTAGVASKRSPWWYFELGKVVADNFKCEYIAYKVYNKGTDVAFIGYEEDVAICIQVFHLASDAIKYFADRYARREYAKGAHMKGLRDDFTRGFIDGLEAKFKMQVEENGWGLIIAKPEGATEFIEGLGEFNTFTRTVTSHSDPELASKARQEGYARGYALDPDAKQLVDQSSK